MTGHSKTLHMGAATKAFAELKCEKISREIRHPELGPMGAEIIKVWTSKGGGTLTMRESMGGCSLTIRGDSC